MQKSFFYRFVLTSSFIVVYHGSSLKDNVSCRSILYWMVLSGSCLSCMLKVSPNVVIAGIVHRPPKPLAEAQCGKWLNRTPVARDDSINSTIIHGFTWSEYEQGLMLSAFYWLHPFMEIPGGILANKYGTKILYGMGILLSTLLGYFLPLATKYHLYANIFIRVLQGVLTGLAFPSTHNLTAKWIPRNERSKFSSSFFGQAIAIAVTYAVSGYIIQYLGWEFVFYITSSLGIVWFLLWWYLVFDSPIQHPRITKDEKHHILKNIEQSKRIGYEDTSVPWKDMLTSVPVWANVVASFCSIWGWYTVLTQGPAYFTFVHGWNIKKTGILAGLPFILTFVFSYIFGNICDCLLKRNKMSRLTVRKLGTFFSAGMCGLMGIGLAFSGCNTNLALFFMFSGATFMGGYSSGLLPNYIDLSPNYASVLLGMSGLVGNSTAFLSAIIVGLLTNGNQTIGQWRLIFFICTALQWSGCIIFLIWGSSEEQSWNSRESKNVDDSEIERVQLRDH